MKEFRKDLIVEDIMAELGCTRNISLELYKTRIAFYLLLFYSLIVSIAAMYFYLY